MIQRIRRNNIPNPGVNGVAVIYDDSNLTTEEVANIGRPRITLFTDQPVTINTYWSESPTGILRLVETESVATPIVASHSTLPITCVAQANLADNDYFGVTYTTVIDGVTTALTKTFEYKVTGGFAATVGRITVDVTGATTATSVAVLTATGIIAAFVGALTAATPASATLTLSAATSGARFTISATEHVADTGFTIGTATTGSESVYDKDLRLRAGCNKVTCVSTTAPTEWGCAVETVNTAVKDN